MDIIRDIIVPFLPKSAPHLAHTPKVFFVSSKVGSKDLDTQPPSFPDNDDANYCITYHVAKASAYQQEWIDSIADGLLSQTEKTVQDVIESLRKKNDECLYNNTIL